MERRGEREGEREERLALAPVGLRVRVRERPRSADSDGMMDGAWGVQLMRLWYESGGCGIEIFFDARGGNSGELAF